MRDETKIFLYWILSLVIIRVALEFPHRELPWIGLVDAAVQILLLILAIRLSILSSGTQRGAMLNLALLFGYALPLMLSSFMGESILPGNPYAPTYTHLYVNKIGAAFISLLTVIYFTTSYLSPRRRSVFQYLLSATLAAGVLALLFGAYAVNPRSLSAEPDYADLVSIGVAEETLTVAGSPVKPETIARELIGTRWKDRSYEDALLRTTAMMPYLGDGWVQNLYWKPVEIREAVANLFCVSVILVVLVRIYRSGNAYSAYLDKILIALGLFHCVEAFHALSSAYSPSWDNYLALREAGHYFTILILLFMIVILNFKIRFIAVGAGQYYERAIAAQPLGTTRFIDEIDVLVLKTFFAKPPHRTMGIVGIRQGKVADHEN